MRKRALSLLLILVMCLGLLPTAAFAAEEKYYSGEDDGMVWDFDRSTGTLTIGGTMHELYYETAASRYLTWPWGSYAGDWYKDIVSVVIQDGVTKIPDASPSSSGYTNPHGPFYDCKNLTSVTIPDSVTKIGSWAFFGCSGLTGITIPDSVTSIGEGAFYRCSGLTSVTIPDRVTRIGSWAFWNCDGLTSVTIPDSVTKIGDGAFSSCENLSQVELGNSVETIGKQAFWIGAYSRPKITNITLPSSIKEAGLSGINHVTLDDSWTRIGPDVKLTGRYETLTIPAGVTEILSGNLGDEIKIIQFKGTFAQWQAISGASGFPEELRNVEVSYGDGSPGLDIAGTVLTKYNGDGGDVVIPESVTEIGWGAFSHAKEVTSVTIPDSVEKIGDNAFRNNDKLASVTLPNSLTAIGSYTFSGCKALTSITIPASVTSIGSNAFSWCKSLTGITLPSALTSIGQEAFMYCESLASITIPASVTSIGSKAFYGSGLKTICGVPGSYAETYAKQNGYAFQNVGVTGPAGKFTDLSPTGFYLDAVAWAVDKKITTGKTDTTFAPKENCTHGQILTFLYRTVEQVKNPSGADMEKAVAWARGKGMIGANFSASAPCTRADAVNYIWQAAGKGAAGYDGRFTDIPVGSPYATAVAWAVDNGVTNGTSATRFTPNRVCDRGTIVTFLYRYFGK